MSFQNLSKGSILYIEALDPFAINTATNQFNYKGATVSPPGNTYTESVAATNGLAFANAGSLGFRRITEHNRAPLSINTERIESSQRMANGTLRKYFVADKLNLNASWEMIPSFRNETVDGGWGAEDIKNFYESTAGRGSFRVKINPTVFSPSLVEGTAALSDDYTYTMVFSSCDFTILKRGLQPFWSVNISLEQV
jgi:hypothetical protein